MTSTLAVLRTPAVLRPNSHLSALLLAPVCYCFYGFIITSSTFTSFLSPSFWDSGTVVIYTSQDIHWSRDPHLVEGFWAVTQGLLGVVRQVSQFLQNFCQHLPLTGSVWTVRLGSCSRVPQGGRFCHGYVILGCPCVIMALSCRLFS